MHHRQTSADINPLGLTFSVVIPCHNAARWIEQSLHSVLAQIYPVLEILVVDDASDDRSLELVTQIRDQTSIPLHILHGDRLGPAGARNLGISQASGDWVAFLDADDWWKPDHLQNIQQAVAETQDVVYIAAAEHYSMNVERVVSRSATPFDSVKNHLDHDTYFQLYQTHGILELSGSAIRRTRLQEVGGFKPEFRGAEDLEIVMRAVHGKTWAYNPTPSHFYRCNNPESHSKKYGLDEQCLTAGLRVFQSLQDEYNISRLFLKKKAVTLLSKAIMSFDSATRKRTFSLAWPYLSTTEKALFTTFAHTPTFYTWLNFIRNRLRGPRYAPRQVIS